MVSAPNDATSAPLVAFDVIWDVTLFGCETVTEQVVPLVQLVAWSQMRNELEVVVPIPGDDADKAYAP